MKTIAAFFRTALAGALLVLVPVAARAGSVSGRVLDSSGKPIAGAKIQWSAYRADDETLLDQTAGTDPSALGEVATNAEGRFRVVLDKPGASVALRLLPAGLPSARLAGPFDSSEENDLSDIQVPAAEKASGQVVDESGRPVPGARVLIASTGLTLDSDTRFLAEVRTGPDGSFSASDAPEGARS